MPATLTAAPATRRAWSAGLGRGVLYLAVWMVIAGGDRADLVPGMLAAALATVASLWLMPPDPIGGRVRWLAALGLLAHFARVSVVAGFDVARRAFAQRMRLDPGFVHYVVRLPPSDARSLFLAMTSQMPGTIPSGTEPTGTIAYHCLDASQPLAVQLAAEEARLVHALGGALGLAAVSTQNPGSTS